MQSYNCVHCYTKLNPYMDYDETISIQIQFLPNTFTIGAVHLQSFGFLEIVSVIHLHIFVSFTPIVSLL